MSFLPIYNGRDGERLGLGEILEDQWGVDCDDVLLAVWREFFKHEWVWQADMPIAIEMVKDQNGSFTALCFYVTPDSDRESRGGGERWIPDSLRDDRIDLRAHECQIVTQPVSPR